ncbi:MAG: acyl carrier protein [Candidatus Kapaibacterium sp.]|jgi:acyl carrier protein
MSDLERLQSAFANALGIDAARINDELAYQQIPEWDSIAHMVLISEIEQEFDISLDTDEVIDLSSFAKAKEILSKYNRTF